MYRFIDVILDDHGADRLRWRATSRERRGFQCPGAGILAPAGLFDCRGTTNTFQAFPLCMPIVKSDISTRCRAENGWPENGVPGEPIRMIAHQFGNGEVFGSGKSQLVCVQMQGYLNFEESGKYLIKANSNDGIRVFLDNKMILNDPDGPCGSFYTGGRDRDQTTGPICRSGAVLSEKRNGDSGNALENTRSRQV